MLDVQVVDNELQGATVLQVAHALSCTHSYDRVLVIEEGRVVEAGTPASLLADSSSRFAALHADARKQGQ